MISQLVLMVMYLATFLIRTISRSHHLPKCNYRNIANRKTLLTSRGSASMKRMMNKRWNKIKMTESKSRIRRLRNYRETSKSLFWAQMLTS